MLPVQFLKFKKKKTQKGTSYAIVKFSDLTNVFELFIFSDIFEINRDILNEGNSLMLTLIKNYTDENKTQKRVNVKKIISLKDVINKALKCITFEFKNIKDVNKLKNLSKKDGNTEIKISLNLNDKDLTLMLKNKRKVDYQLLNTLDLADNVIVD